MNDLLIIFAALACLPVGILLGKRIWGCEEGSSERADIFPFDLSDDRYAALLEEQEKAERALVLNLTRTRDAKCSLAHGIRTAERVRMWKHTIVKHSKPYELYVN